MIEERAHLLPLAEQGFELAEIAFPRVDGLGCVRVRTNLYSVPAAPGKTVEVRLYPSYVEVRDEGRLHRLPRALSRTAATSARPGTLSRCTGAQTGRPDRLQAARGLAATRLWPPSYDRLLDELIHRHGRQSGTRQMIQVLSLIKQHGHATGAHGGGRSNRSGLCGCRGGPASGGSRGPDPCAQCAHRVGRTCPFRTTITGDHRLRWVA